MIVSGLLPLIHREWQDYKAGIPVCPLWEGQASRDTYPQSGIVPERLCPSGSGWIGDAEVLYALFPDAGWL